MSYDGVIVKRLRLPVTVLALLLSVTLDGQVRQRVSPAETGDFGSKFFEDLRSLFGRLQQAELDRAFQRARPIHCPDLVSQRGEWKQVAFLNDDRKLGDWHYDSLAEVKNDLASFVFSGVCRSDDGPVKVATSYPVEETFKRYAEGRIPLSEVVISDNDPVTAMFDRFGETYTFQLPYLYLERKDNLGALYTLTPPTLSSRPEPGVAEEFRCKALSDAELTYRFMLCRTRVVDRDPRIQQQKQRTSQPLGNAAYYILSDGKEASSSVKISFGDNVEPPVPVPAPAAAPPTNKGPEWQPATPQARLVDIGGDEFRLRFNEQAWSGRTGKAQIIAGQTLSDFDGSTPAGGREYCVWRPVSTTPLPSDDSMVFWLTFRKDAVTSATIDVENHTGKRIASLHCFFPQSSNPADLTADRLTAIAGRSLTLEVRSR